MSTFRLIADLDSLDGTPSTYVTLDITAVLPEGSSLVGPTGAIIDKSLTVEAVGGILGVDLPATDVAPYEFGYLISRKAGKGRQFWRVPAQAPGVVERLDKFTTSTPLPAPDSVFVRTVAGLADDVTAVDLAAALEGLIAPLPADLSLYARKTDLVEFVKASDLVRPITISPLAAYENGTI